MSIQSETDPTDWRTATDNIIDNIPSTETPTPGAYQEAVDTIFGFTDVPYTSIDPEKK